MIRMSGYCQKSAKKMFQISSNRIICISFVYNKAAPHVIYQDSFNWNHIHNTRVVFRTMRLNSISPRYITVSIVIYSTEKAFQITFGLFHA